MPLPGPPWEEDDELTPEGRVLARVHRSYERNAKNRSKKLVRFKRDNHHARRRFDFEQINARFSVLSEWCPLAPQLAGKRLSQLNRRHTERNGHCESRFYLVVVLQVTDAAHVLD